MAVGAANRVTVSDQQLLADRPQHRRPRQPSMIARCGPRTRLPDAHSRWAGWRCSPAPTPPRR